MNVIVATLESMTSESVISSFISRQQNEQLYQLQDILAHANTETQNRWYHAMTNVFTLK